MKKSLMIVGMALMLSCAASAKQPKTFLALQPGYTVKVENNHELGNGVVVCRILPPGVIVGGGDNCDFHFYPDPVYCSFFPKDKGCRHHPENLPNQCGTSFGCQNLDAFKRKRKSSNPYFDHLESIGITDGLIHD